MKAWGKREMLHDNDIMIIMSFNDYIMPLHALVVFFAFFLEMFQSTCHELGFKLGFKLGPA